MLPYITYKEVQYICVYQYYKNTSLQQVLIFKYKKINF